MDIKADLKELCGAVGVSGDEFAASEKAAELLRRFTDNVIVDAFGNVIGRINSEVPDAKLLLIDAHIDSVGLLVTHIEENGFLRVGACGSPDIRTLLAQSVTVHGREEIQGVVSTLPPHVRKDSKVPEIEDISIDVGLPKEQVEALVSQGDRVTVNSSFRELCGDMVSAPAIDDRSGVCAVLAALEMLNGKPIPYNIVVCFSAQEETGERGAKQVAARIKPDEAIVVDVSFGRTPDSSPRDTADLGSGVMIGFSPFLSMEMSDTLRDLAISEKIPFTCEVMPSSTGTNADVIGVSGNGVKCCTLSFPIRYMHTSIECVLLKDIEAVSKLICAYVLGGAANG